jgi:membrane protease YdiL (CAAX protease family)
MKARFRNIELGVEFVLLFFGVPLLFFFDKLFIHPSVVLLPILAALILYFRLNKNFSLKQLIQLKIPKNIIRANIVILLLSGLFLLSIVLVFERSYLFDLPRKNPRIWILLCIFYPITSVYIQEVIYRAFLFLRYKPFFRNKWSLIIASGIAFSFVHIIYYNQLSIILTLIAGIYLAYIYEKTRSVMFTAILHSIIGDVIFTIGLGHHFWLDMYRWL